jgi:hypothetical protein
MLTMKTFLDADYTVLDRALTSLGFTKTITDEAFIYYHKPSDSILVFPLGAAEDKVALMNMVSVRKTVLERGIAPFSSYWNAFRDASGGRRRPAPKEATRTTK